MGKGHRAGLVAASALQEHAGQSSNFQASRVQIPYSRFPDCSHVTTQPDLRHRDGSKFSGSDQDRRSTDRPRAIDRGCRSLVASRVGPGRLWPKPRGGGWKECLRLPFHVFVGCPAILERVPAAGAGSSKALAPQDTHGLLTCDFRQVLLYAPDASRGMAWCRISRADL